MGPVEITLITFILVLAFLGVSSFFWIMRRRDGADSVSKS